MTDDKWGAGSEGKWSHSGRVTVDNASYPLIYGEHKHSYRDNKFYVLDGREEPTPFDGHHSLIHVKLESINYRKESELSGDEIRKGGDGEILSDNIVVYTFFFRDVEWALLRAHYLIGKLREHPSEWLNKEERDKLVGRKIYYERTACVIDSLIVDQGCLMLKTADGNNFPPAVYEIEDEHEAGFPYCEKRSTLKTNVLDPKIWWFRNIEVKEEAEGETS